MLVLCFSRSSAFLIQSQKPPGSSTTLSLLAWPSLVAMSYSIDKLMTAEREAKKLVEDAKAGQSCTVSSASADA